MASSPSRVIVITGGSSGIGRCTAALFARRGWRVGLIARGETGLRAAAEDIRAAGGHVATASADVADADALQQAADQLARELGPPEVWINAAAAGFYARFMDMTETEYRRVMDVTFMGTVHGTRAALAAMTPRGRGSVINVASALGFRAVPLQSAYCAAKFAMRGFTEAVRSELIHDRSPIHLGIVHPPSVNTPFFSHAGMRMTGVHANHNPAPPPPVYAPEVIAEGIWLAVSERRRELRITGASVQLTWMNRLMPRVFDQLAARIGMAAQMTPRAAVAAVRDPSLFDAPRLPSPMAGPFKSVARTHSTQMWAQRHRLSLGLAAVGLAFALRPRFLRQRRS